MDQERISANKPSDMGVDPSNTLDGIGNPNLRSALTVAMRNLANSSAHALQTGESAPTAAAATPKQQKSLEAESKLLAEQAATLKSQRMQETTAHVADRLSKKAHAKNVQDAMNDSYSRVARWILFLPVPRRQQIIMGRIFSFMCTKGPDGKSGEYRMSIGHGAKELNIGRSNLDTGRKDYRNDLRDLVEQGYVRKRSNGARKPATYVLDLDFCLEKAREAGWKPRSEEDD